MIGRHRFSRLLPPHDVQWAMIVANDMGWDAQTADEKPIHGLTKVTFTRNVDTQRGDNEECPLQMALEFELGHPMSVTYPL